MSARSEWLRSTVLGALAFAGVVSSHQIAYHLAAPDHHERAELLASTGHRNFGFIAAAWMALLVFFLAAFLRRAIASEPSHNRFGFTVARLLPVQVGLFLMLESSERVFGGDIEGLLREPAVLIGIGVQVLLAIVGALLLLGVGYVARRLTGARHLSTADTGSPSPASAETHRLLSRIATGGAAPRAPPLA